LTKIVSHCKQPDGRSNLLVVGLHRIQLVDELPAHRAYREASVDLLDERSSSLDLAQRQQVRRQLLDAFKRRLCSEVHEAASLDELLEREVSLGVLTDLIAHTLDLEFALKVRLLAECDVDRRASILLDALSVSYVGSAVSAVGGGHFPPHFSAN
jgi:Lon protease-like protein